ncbi:two-component regulator propeller domain-containing protein [Aquiflexum sp.]|uniref:sensor histidine kinase n=1 Tax=Aquiflexum sp. TaxID=1872584 RepID=UPI00359362A5
MKRLFLFILFVQLSILVAANTNRFFNRITVDDGLASNNVYALWQDKKGYLWIGSTNGLQRFDGKFFMYYNIRKPQPLPAKPVQQILEDREGNMWIRYGDDYGIFNPADLSFKKVPFEKPQDRFLGERLWTDSKGNVFVILVRSKILYYNKEKEVFSEENSPIKLPEGYRPNSIFEDTKTGFYWISSQEGIAVFDPKTQETYHISHNPLKLPNLENASIKQGSWYFIDSERNHWMAFWNEDPNIISFSEGTNQFTQSAKNLKNQTQEYREMNHAFETKSGELWFYGVNSLFVSNSNQNGTFDYLRDEFMKHSVIHQVYEDRDGGIWLASDEGIYHYADNFPDITYGFFRDGDPKHVFLEIKEIHTNQNKQTQYWVTSWGRGIVVLDENLKELSSQKIFSKISKKPETLQTWTLLQERKSKKVWVGAQRGWLQIINPDTHETELFNFPVFRQSTIRSISQDKSGNIWFTTQRGDLIRYNADQPIENDSFHLVRAFNGFAIDHLIDIQNRIWVCTTNSGVFCLDAGTGEILKHLDESILSSNKQERITQLNDSIFFFGYDLLNAYNDKSGENRILSYSDGMISNKINKMLIDKDGFLWIYTPNGICKYNYTQNSFTQYGQKDGFGLLEMDGSGGTFTNNGQLIFTGYSSMVSFKPSQFNSPVKPDQPTLTSIKLFDEYLFVDSLNTVTNKNFGHEQNAFTFYFSSLNYTNRDKLKYFHRLSGIDQDWKSSGQNNMAVYSLLPAGRYTLEFRSENEAGISSSIGSFDFRISPPFYETWWFRLLVITIVLWTILLIYRLHINRVLAVVKVRNRVARDLHDDMGSTLSTINILSSMAKTKLHTDPAKTSDYISKISDNSQRMMEAMDDIVWSIKPQNDTMEKVIARMREFTTNALEAKDIDFRFEVEENVYEIKLPMDARRDLFLVFKEAVNNLAKYSKCSRAFIHFSLKKGKLHMRVRDYGMGFDPQLADSGNGLNNMKKRAQNMGGELKITSEIGEGTEVVLDVGV